MSLDHRVHSVLEHVQGLAREAGVPTDVCVVAAAKTRTADEVRQAVSAGLRCIGENYLNEALPKIHALSDLTIEWHFIGAIQSNKTRPIAAHFDWVHSIDRLPVAERLGRQRPSDRGPLNVCLQVNMDGETSKAGIAPAAARTLAAQVSAVDGLHLRGLMAIPAPRTGPDQHQPFQALRDLRDTLVADLNMELPVLSMGMSADYPAAIAHGATHVRIGTALFGARPARNPTTAGAS